MVSMSIKFPYDYFKATTTTVTFSIGHIRCRTSCIIQVILHLYDLNGTEIGYDYTREEVINYANAYEGFYTAIGYSYVPFIEEMLLPKKLVETAAYYQLEIVTYGITSENPLYFNRCMFQEGIYNGYHTPNELHLNAMIEFNKNCYANLYFDDDDYLQVIRPADKRHFGTKKIHQDPYTILVPHISSEPSIDDPVNILLEFINQTEQKINISR